MVKIVICFTGPIGSGKSSISDELVRKVSNCNILRTNASIISGDNIIENIPLSNEVYKCCNIIYNHLNLPTEKNRRLLQAVGDIGRNSNPDFWVNKVIDEISKSCSSYFIVPDIRYPNEVEKLRSVFPVLHFKLTGSYRPEETIHSSENSMTFYQLYNGIFEHGYDIEQICNIVIAHLQMMTFSRLYQEANGNSVTHYMRHII